jgi:hypothetical protein
MFLYGDRVKVKGKLFSVINVNDSDDKNIKYLLSRHNEHGVELNKWYKNNKWYKDTNIEFVCSIH